MAKVELKKKWWTGARPRTVKGVELEKTLGAIDAAADSQRRLAALQALPAAIHKTRTESKGLTQTLKDLDALQALADEQARRLAAEQARAAAAEDDDALPAAQQLDPAAHRSTLRRALRQPLLFGFSLGSRPEARLLALSPRGNPLKLKGLVREHSGGARSCCGRLFAAPGEADTLRIELQGPALPGTAKALRQYLKENRLTLFRRVRVVAEEGPGESAALDDDDEVTAPASDAGPGETATAATANAVPEPAQLDRRRAFRQARAAWVAAKARAEQDLEQVKDGARLAYLADPGQWPKVAAGCRAIDDLLGQLDDELRDTLDRYAATPLREPQRLHELAAAAAAVLERYQRFVDGNALLRAIDEREFADVQVRAPVSRALAELRRVLA